MKHIVIALVAILAITGMVLFAISRGIDGVILSLGIASVAGLGGYEINLIKSKVIKK